ncbi:MAG: DUF2066 domain-containing protein [Pseudomonadota bacterium]|nr:DUF2066 domain-containing protein [Pseudomonadota bacterium]
MRSFILFVTILSFVVMKPLYAGQTNSNSFALFTIVETFDPEVSESGKVMQKPDLDSKIQKGMRDLLVRLTGDHAILTSAEGESFIKGAKSWLSTYHFDARKEDGVTIGQNLVLDFDRQRLLKAFQAAQIQIWPKSERPATMLMGSYLEAGSLLKLNAEILGYRPDIDYRYYPTLLALPYRVADDVDSWVYPVGSSQVSAKMSQRIQEMLIQSGQDYLLSFQAEQNPGQMIKLYWRLFDKSGNALGSAKIEGKKLQPLMQTMFNRMIGAYSYSYRQSAGVLNVANVMVDQLTSAQQLIEVEAYLKSQKPTVHQVFLQEMVGAQANFEVIYQGRYTDFLSVVTSIESSVLVDESAITGEINLRLKGLGILPETQLIDLSKEFEGLKAQDSTVVKEQQGQ